MELWQVLDENGNPTGEKVTTKCMGNDWRLCNSGRKIC